MKKEFDTLVQTLTFFEGVTVFDSLYDPVETYITFQCTNQKNLTTLINQVNEIKDTHHCRLLSFPNYDIPNDPTYQIVFRGSEEIIANAIVILLRFLKGIVETGSTEKIKQQELGLPDLSLTTIRQMALELKKRENLCFAIVWIEDNERDNIAIEGSGNPTQLVGLLSRGLHMTIEWADKNIKFHKPKED
jgi:hypothetical protein